MATSLPESQYFAVLFDDKYYVGKYLSYDGDILLLMLMELFLILLHQNLQDHMTIVKK